MVDKLRFLIALAREQHFGRAAEACGVTQPTLSAGLKQIEASLGTPLVRRSARYQGLTPEGERVLLWAQRIVGDVHAMREDVRALRQGLTGALRLAAIPTALAMVPALTTPFRARYPGVRFTVLASSSDGMLAMIGNLVADAGLTYLDNEPLGRMRSVPLYRERYRLLVARASPLGERERVSWAEVGQVPLCLLTPDMQNRRIIDRLLLHAAGTAAPTLESNSMIALFAHVRTGEWATVMPDILATTLGLTDMLRAIPIVDPEETHAIGLVVPDREPQTPLLAALVVEAEALSRRLDRQER